MRGSYEMRHTTHSLPCLFSKLGIDSSRGNIEKFIDENCGLPADIALAEAACWNESQAEFLKYIITNESEWSEVVQHLDMLLR